MRTTPTPLLIAAVIGACGQPDPGAELEQQRADVAEAGAMVMPFDLEATTHFFERRDDGGVQTIVSDDRDPDQVALIREHLAEEAARFSRGDFHDPAMIHGEDMEGLHQLVAGHERLTIVYSEIPGGGEIRYSSEDATLVEAIHSWFDAQLRDHGEHAEAHR